jgi:hypothetical protein
MFVHVCSLVLVWVRVEGQSLLCGGPASLLLALPSKSSSVLEHSGVIGGLARTVYDRI